MSALITEGLAFGDAPLVLEDLGGGAGQLFPTTCLESLEGLSIAPTISTLEAQILTAQAGFPRTELLRSVFVQNCSTSTWPVAVARTVLFYANSTEVSNVLNGLYPGINPAPSILCNRIHTVAIDNTLTPFYGYYSAMLGELSSRGIPTDYLNLLNRYMQPESPVYRVCSVAVCIVLASIISLRG